MCRHSRPPVAMCLSWARREAAIDILTSEFRPAARGGSPVEPQFTGCSQAHQPDEFIALDYLEPTVDLLGGLIERFCVGPAARSEAV